MFKLKTDLGCTFNNNKATKTKAQKFLNEDMSTSNLEIQGIPAIMKMGDIIAFLVMNRMELVQDEKKYYIYLPNNKCLELNKTCYTYALHVKDLVNQGVDIFEHDKVIYSKILEEENKKEDKKKLERKIDDERKEESKQRLKETRRKGLDNIPLTLEVGLAKFVKEIVPFIRERYKINIETTDMEIYTQLLVNALPEFAFIFADENKLLVNSKSCLALCSDYTEKQILSKFIHNYAILNIVMTNWLHSMGINLIDKRNSSVKNIVQKLSNGELRRKDYPTILEKECINVYYKIVDDSAGKPIINNLKNRSRAIYFN